MLTCVRACSATNHALPATPGTVASTLSTRCRAAPDSSRQVLYAVQAMTMSATTITCSTKLMR
jgi:hypothetical protein